MEKYNNIYYQRLQTNLLGEIIMPTIEIIEDASRNSKPLASQYLLILCYLYFVTIPYSSEMHQNGFNLKFK